MQICNHIVIIPIKPVEKNHLGIYKHDLDIINVKIRNKIIMPFYFIYIISLFGIYIHFMMIFILWLYYMHINLINR